MEPITGFNPTTELPAYHAKDPKVRRGMGFNLVEGIAALGAVNHQNVGLEGFGKPEGFLERQVPQWQAQLSSYNDILEWPGSSEIKGIETAAQWLLENCPANLNRELSTEITILLMSCFTTIEKISSNS